MPLGASITYGLKSSDGNGYRKYLRDRIVAYGNDVNMVGSRRNGTMEDNDVEGWPGYIIDQVHDAAVTAVPKVCSSKVATEHSFLHNISSDGTASSI
jgi:hypothetical protein